MFLMRGSEYPPDLRLTDLRLPAGEAIRVDMTESADAPPTTITIFSLAGAAGFYRLWCTSDAPPADRWLSIAETIEFLPAGE